jgi:hypothetical protein
LIFFALFEGVSGNRVLKLCYGKAGHEEALPGISLVSIPIFSLEIAFPVPSPVPLNVNILVESTVYWPWFMLLVAKPRE